MKADAEETSGGRRILGHARTLGAIVISVAALGLAGWFAAATWWDSSAPPDLGPIVAVGVVVLVVLYACTDLHNLWRGLLVGSAVLLIAATASPLVLGWQRSWDECLARLPVLPGDWRITRSFDPVDSTITCRFAPADDAETRTDTFSLWELV